MICVSTALGVTVWAATILVAASLVTGFIVWIAYKAKREDYIDYLAPSAYSASWIEAGLPDMRDSNSAWNRRDSNE